MVAEPMWELTEYSIVPRRMDQNEFPKSGILQAGFQYLPGRFLQKPGFGRARVNVRSARICNPGVSPVVASKPNGKSNEITLFAYLLISSMYLAVVPLGAN